MKRDGNGKLFFDLVLGKKVVNIYISIVGSKQK